MKNIRKKKDIDFIFASSSINVRENRSTLNETIKRVSTAESYSEAMKIFSESGLDDGSGDFMSSLDRQSALLYEFLREVTDQNSQPIIAYMNASREVMELKTAIKSYVFSVESNAEKTDRERQLDAMVAKCDFSGLGCNMLETAASDALKEASESRDPQVVDTVLDSALYAYRKDISENSGIPFLETVCKNDIDIKNICTAFRLKRRKSLPEDIGRFIYEGGDIKKSDIIGFINESGDFQNAFKQSEYGVIALTLSKESLSPQTVEKALEDKYFEELTKVKNDIFGSGKVVAYAILYEKWLSDLRIMLTAKKVGRAI